MLEFLERKARARISPPLTRRGARARGRGGVALAFTRSSIAFDGRKLHADHAQHPLQVPNHIVVHEPNDTYTFAPQILGSLTVVISRLLAVMGSAVQLDREPGTRTIEVHDEWPEAVLPAEFPAEPGMP